MARRPLHRSANRYIDQTQAPGLATLSETLDVCLGNVERRRSTFPAVATFACGTRLIHHKDGCCYRLSFHNDLPDAEFRDLFRIHIKPLLVEQHELEGGRSVSFRYDPDRKDWAIRYLHKVCDTDGKPILNEGRPVWQSCHRQVESIAREVARQADAMLCERLGRAPAAGLGV